MSKRSTEKSKTKKDDEKNEKRKLRSRRNRARAARELDFSDSEASEKSLLVIKAAYRVDDSKKLLIDSGATSYCMEDRSIFDSLTPRGGELTTAGGSLEIKGRGDVTIVLPNSSTAKLDSVLFVPRIGMS